MGAAIFTPEAVSKFPMVGDSVSNFAARSRLKALIVPSAAGFIDLVTGHHLSMSGAWIYRVNQGAPALVHDGTNTCYATSNHPNHLLGTGPLDKFTVVAGYSAATTNSVSGICNSASLSVDQRINLMVEVYPNTSNIGIVAAAADNNSGIAAKNAEPTVTAWGFTHAGASIRTAQGEYTVAFTDTNSSSEQFTLGCVYRYAYGYQDPLTSGDAIYFVAIFAGELSSAEMRQIIANPRKLVTGPLEAMRFLNSAQTAAAFMPRQQYAKNQAVNRASRY